MTDETPAAAATRDRCQYAEITIGEKHARLDPIITPDGRLNSLQGVSPATAGGGCIFVIVEPLHGDTCAALAGGAACDCGAQAALEGFVFEG